jgi:hypothetical protein
MLADPLSLVDLSIGSVRTYWHPARHGLQIPPPGSIIMKLQCYFSTVQYLRVYSVKAFHDTIRGCSFMIRTSIIAVQHPHFRLSLFCPFLRFCSLLCLQQCFLKFLCRNDGLSFEDKLFTRYPFFPFVMNCPHLMQFLPQNCHFCLQSFSNAAQTIDMCLDSVVDIDGGEC